MALNDFQKGRLRRHLHHTSAVIDDDGNEITPGGGTAASVTFTPTGGIAATNVQTALAELDTEKATTGSVTSAIAALSSVYQPLDSDLTAIAALTTTSFGRSLLALADATALGANHTHGGSTAASVSAAGKVYAAANWR